ncbi:hypothetical protein ABZT17_01100 [Streptomyces sp. NPDC005648]|uniref:hypothetical protein n=1 Tax=Streptomyces sp. NPDC005648 TaxID=3157044 RepID=UPI0033B78284
MERVRLTPRGRLILTGIEQSLRGDRRLTHGMRDERRHRSFSLPLAAALLGTASVCLMFVDIRTSNPGVIWVFAGA